MSASGQGANSSAVAAGGISSDSNSNQVHRISVIYSVATLVERFPWRREPNAKLSGVPGALQSLPALDAWLRQPGTVGATEGAHPTRENGATSGTDVLATVNSLDARLPRGCGDLLFPPLTSDCATAHFMSFHGIFSLSENDAFDDAAVSAHELDT